MTRTIITPLLLCIALHVSAQQEPALSAQTDSLIRELQTINRSIAGPRPAPGKQMLLSNRALNIFLSEAAGYYLSDVDNLTLYKNSVVADAAGGTLAIYHNLRQAPGTDERIHSFTSIGARADLADAVIATSDNRPYNNRFGFLFKQTWVGRPHTSATPDQIRTMDALRAAALNTQIIAIREKAARADSALHTIDPQDIPGQDPANAQNTARKKFDTDLREEAQFEYAYTQAEALTQTFNYRLMSFSWTSFSLYLPLITEDFHTAPDLATIPGSRHAWPAQANITHTRLWESSHFGRLFLTLAGDLTLNNTRDARQLTKAGNDYIGDYQTFLTPAIKGQVIWFPKNSHIGASFLLEQNIGDEHALNGRLGVPVVLIDKKARPALNFEFQVRFYDMGHTIADGKGLPGHTAIGLTIGIPCSKIAY